MRRGKFDGIWGDLLGGNQEVDMVMYSTCQIQYIIRDMNQEKDIISFNSWLMIETILKI